MSSTVGILGSGQLARMLAESARGRDLRVAVLGSHPKDSAMEFADQVWIGEGTDTGLLQKFAESCGVVLFESENVHPEAIQQTGLGPRCVPSLEVIALLQNKALQKQLADELKIGTAPWKPWNDPESSARELLSDWARMSALPCVVKLSRGGFDGRGTWIAPEGEISDQKWAELEALCAQGVPLYVEEKVRFQHEFAVSVFRSSAGETLTLPAVLSFQEQGMCRWTKMPAQAYGISEQAVTEACEALTKIANHLGVVGGLTGEFFLDPQGRVLLNELAPRVHNSAHWTRGGATCSQFDLQVDAALGRTLTAPLPVAPFVGMLNLIGKEIQLDLSLDTSVLRTDYKKGEPRPGRKMGHLVVLAASARELDLKLESLIQKLGEKPK
jgi:5-(carboxyamino)imidazole ribonucleotide synthase